MTTEVIIAIKGNKSVKLDIVEPGQNGQPGTTVETKIVRPQEFTTVFLHSERYIVAKETGEFLSGQGG